LPNAVCAGFLAGISEAIVKSTFGTSRITLPV
jgi:hypothetical protein